MAFDTVESFLSGIASQYEALPRQLRAVAKHVEENRARMVVTRITDIAEACAVQPDPVLQDE